MLPMMNNNSNDMLMKFGSLLATIMFARAMYEQYLPYQWREAIRSYLLRYTERVVRFFSPYMNITFEEYTGERFNRCEIYTTIETYLSEMTSMKARGLKANFVTDGKALVFGLGDNEEVTDEFKGIKVWWRARRNISRGQTITFYPGTDEKRHYELTFHGRHKKEIMEVYVPYVFEEGKAIAIRKRQRKLFTNIKDSESHGYNRSKSWSHIEFKHPATFGTLALEATKKRRIMKDLLRFKTSKNYYAKIGKPWKRGYLLYGPPGTGKSTMIAAMANYMEYDIYDLELTAVKDKTQLRKLLIETTSKSIIVIEDIDCSLDLTGQRSKKKEKGDEEKDEEKDPLKKKLEEGENKKSEVTLSGLLNFIDGIWSACGEERLIIFTTNYIDKLDPALIRTGRMDVHIELSYCCYEAFKVLAKNYLSREKHPLFETIETLLKETKMTPADVAEHLMPKWVDSEDEASLEKLAFDGVDENFMPELHDPDVDACLENLIRALQKAKEDDKLKAEEEERQKQKTIANGEEGDKLEEASATLEEDKVEPKDKDKMEEGSTSKPSVDKEEKKLD